MLVWRHGSTLRPCKCPLCRRPISLLVPSEETVRVRNDAAVSEVLHDVETYNRVFGGQSSGLVQVRLSSFSSLWDEKQIITDQS